MAAAVAEADALRARRETKRQKNASESKQAAIDDAAAAATASLSAEAASKSPDLSPVAGDVAFLEQKTFKINDEAVESVLSQVEQLGAAGAAAKLKEMKHKTLEPTASSTSVMSTNSLYDVPADRFDVKSIQVCAPKACFSFPTPCPQCVAIKRPRAPGLWCGRLSIHVLFVREGETTKHEWSVGSHGNFVQGTRPRLFLHAEPLRARSRCSWFASCFRYGGSQELQTDYFLHIRFVVY